MITHSLSKKQLSITADIDGIKIECFSCDNHESLGKFDSLKKAAQELYLNPQKAKGIHQKIDRPKSKSWSKVKQCYFYVKSIKE